MSIKRSRFPLVLFTTFFLQSGNLEPSRADDVATPRVVLNVSGSFSTDPASIRVTGTPGPFPMPAMFGGTFLGSVSYSLDDTGSMPQIYREFFLDTVEVEIRDRNGTVLHTIANGANPFKVTDGEATFAIGASAQGQPGHTPLTPTDLRFQLLSAEFLKASTTPPTAAAINSASLGKYIGFGAFIELDSDRDPFHGWDLPIVSMSVSAVEIPEPPIVSLLILAGSGLLAVGRR